MNERDPRDVWAPGIPKYTDDDLLHGKDLLEFAMNIIWQYEIEPKKIKVIDATIEDGRIPNIVCKLNGKMSFVVVKAAIYPEEAKMSVEEKKNLVAHAAKFNADPYFAAVGLMPTDPERMKASLALKNDGFYIKYEGFEKIQFKRTTEWIRKALKEINELDPESQTTVSSVDTRHSLSKPEPTDFEKWKEGIMVPTFQNMLLECIQRKGMTNPEFYNAALLDRKLFSAIYNNPNYQPKKETAVACCFGLKLCLADAEKLLELAGYTLSLSISWDRVVYYCLRNCIFDLDVVNELLYEEGGKCIRV